MHCRLLVALALGVVRLLGQALSGHITTDDGMPLPAASVMELHCGESVSLPIPLDQNGGFRLERNDGGKDCSIWVNSPGYRPSGTAISNLPRSPRIPAIVLYRLGKSHGESISASHLMAPPEAKRHYHAAMRELQRHDGPEPVAVDEHLRAAVEAFPGYAQAWFEIGRLRLAGGEPEGALQALQRAVEADPWFVSPYEPLILLLRAAGKPDAAATACQGLRRINSRLPADCGMR
ncbi:MAG: bacterial transcriptional activator domain-containing protein [Bryobacterales bacterium]|nr:bacterial transcriptional activator domain-containing protein [Bryobacterales bacterium]